jgi:ABC-type nitrate/sulfonate/bicarbonate transport system permease component
MRALFWRLGSLAVLAGFVAIWAEIAALKLVPPLFLPSPLRAWNALVAGFARGDLLAKLEGTLAHMATGWVAASLLGVALGAVIGSSARAREFVGPTLEFLRPLPASAVIPVAIAMFGLTPQMAIGVIAFGSIWPMLLSTVHGFAHVEPRLIEVARALHMSRLAVVWKIALPSALPDILAGLRLGLTVALILSVVCEMIAGIDGLGAWELVAARAYRSPDIFAGVILLGAIGLIANSALAAAESRALRWRGR